MQSQSTSAPSIKVEDLDTLDTYSLTTSSRPSYTVNFERIVYDGYLYLSILGSPWKALFENYLDESTDLARVSTSSELRVRESEEPLRSQLMSLAAERGEYWLKFDERMDILCRDALKRIQAFIDSQSLPRPVKVVRVSKEDLHRHHGVTYVAGGGGGGGSGYGFAAGNSGQGSGGQSALIYGNGGDGNGSSLAHALVFDETQSWSPSEHEQHKSRLIRSRT